MCKENDDAMGLRGAAFEAALLLREGDKDGFRKVMLDLKNE